MRVVVVGGGAAGFFAAIAAAESGLEVSIVEATSKVLGKVLISGGGRCNVTHACFDPRLLVQHYPRGGKELRGPFSRFQPGDTVDWFQSRGVRLKTEADGRMFPLTDRSTTIANCLQRAAQQAGVRVMTSCKVSEIQRAEAKFRVLGTDGKDVVADRLLLATGGSRAGLRMAEHLGHTIEPPVPSLFTFKMRDRRLHGLAGVSVDDAHLELATSTERLRQNGPLLITHWGLSGPAVLKLSAWGARALYQDRYRAKLTINWLPNRSPEAVRNEILGAKQTMARKTMDSQPMFEFPRRLWKSLVQFAVGPEVPRWAETSSHALQRLLRELTAGEHEVTGKGEFKEEFVTCGGVRLSEVDFKTMQSRVCPGLYFAGEILDIDGVTGGFNFQNAWTTGWLAGISMLDDC